MAENQETVEGGQVIQGDLTVLGSINNEGLDQISTKIEKISGVAQSVSGSIGALINGLGDDGVISITEKVTIKNTWEGFEAEYSALIQNAVKMNVTTKAIDAYKAAYDALRRYLFSAPGILQDLKTESITTKAEYLTAFGGYITARGAIAQNIDETTSKELQLLGVNITLSSYELKRTRLGTVEPATIVMRAELATGEPFLGRFLIELYAGGNWIQDYMSLADESIYSYTVPAMANSSWVDSVRCSIYQSGGNGNALRDKICTVAFASTTSVQYWGSRLAPPTNGYIYGDYFFDANEVADGGGVLRFCAGSTWILYSSNLDGWADARGRASTDIMIWAGKHRGVSNDTVSAALAVFDSLTAAEAFITKLATSELEVLGTIKTGVGAADDARVAVIDYSGCSRKTFVPYDVSHPGNDDMRIIEDAATEGVFEVVIDSSEQYPVGATGPGNGKVFYKNPTNGYGLECSPTDGTVWGSLDTILFTQQLQNITPKVYGNFSAPEVVKRVTETGEIIWYRFYPGGSLPENKIDNFDFVENDTIVVQKSIDGMNWSTPQSIGPGSRPNALVSVNGDIYISAVSAFPWSTPYDKVSYIYIYKSTDWQTFTVIAAIPSTIFDMWGTGWGNAFWVSKGSSTHDVTFKINQALYQDDPADPNRISLAYFYSRGLATSTYFDTIESVDGGVTWTNAGTYDGDQGNPNFLCGGAANKIKCIGGWNGIGSGTLFTEWYAGALGNWVIKFYPNSFQGNNKTLTDAGSNPIHVLSGSIRKISNETNKFIYTAVPDTGEIVLMRRDFYVGFGTNDYETNIVSKHFTEAELGDANAFIYEATNFDLIETDNKTDVWLLNVIKSVTFDKVPAKTLATTVIALASNDTCWSLREGIVVGTKFQDIETGEINASLADNINFSYERALQIPLQMTKDGKSDWYLPSLAEMRAIYNQFANTAEKRTASGITTGSYWTSSEYSASRAMLVTFSNNGSEVYTEQAVRKTSRAKIILVRKFQETDRFKWKEQNDATYRTTQTIEPDGSYLLTGFGIKIAFGTTFGHKTGDKWTFRQGALSAISVRTVSGNEYFAARAGIVLIGSNDSASGSDITKKRIAIYPPYNTGGPWYVATRDPNSSESILLLMYGNTEVARFYRTANCMEGVKRVRAADNGNGYIEITTDADALPGVVGSYPTLKTSFPWIYLSTNGVYAGALGRVSGGYMEYHSNQPNGHRFYQNVWMPGLNGFSPDSYMRYEGWVNNPGYNANTIAPGRSGFTYSNGAPYNGPLVSFAADGYELQLNAPYWTIGLAFRTRNGDNGTWNPWKPLISLNENSGANDVDFPIGTVVYCTNVPAARNVAVDVYLDSDARTYSANTGAGARLSGVWRSCGGVATSSVNRCVCRRVG